MTAVGQVLAERRTPRWWVEHFVMRGYRDHPMLAGGRPVTLAEFLKLARGAGATEAELSVATASYEARLAYVRRLAREAEELVWAAWPWQRCRARMERRPGLAYYGRCDLARHGAGVDHALERGFDIVRWSTEPTG